MRRLPLALVFVITTAVSAAVGVPSVHAAVGAHKTSAVVAPIPPPKGAAGPWKLEFNSTFTGSSLNTAQWSYGVYPHYRGPVNLYESENYSPSNVRVENGSLRLSLIARTNTYVGPRNSLVSSPRTEPYLSGAVNTFGKEVFTYGFFQARIFDPGNRAGQIYNWPAFWLTNTNWPENGEIDIFEGLGGQAGWHFHYGTLSDPLADGTNASGRFTGWHTFGADWEPGSITYYYDGRRVGTITQNVTSSPLYLILNLAAGGYGGPISAPSTMQISYVRVWTH